ANEAEMEVLTGHTDIQLGAKMLSGWGVKEVVITLGSLGSVIYADDIFYNIPAYVPATITDATGCGDTYMAGYLYKRVKGAGIQDAGEFGAAMASLKIEASGPFTGTNENVQDFLNSCKQKP
ncbi:MAG: ribokinase, partial [Ferruginibacter sp.]|nr:ribokinase [Ferruginibacter sp.]